MGMPFLQQYKVTLDPANGEAKFGSFNNYIIKCQRYSTAATITSTATAVTTAAARMGAHEQIMKMAPNIMKEKIRNVTRLQEGISRSISR
jgi:hypothetical protein